MFDEDRLWFIAKVVGWCLLGCFLMACYGCAALVGVV